MAVACLQIASPAAAQTLFEQLFGLVAPPAGGLVTAPRLRGAEPVVTPAPDPHRRRLPADGDGGGKVQTMCVRTCDGYYWPIRYPAATGDLSGDESQCKASCGTEVKLYTRAGPGTDAEEMKDQDGRSYGASPTAFLYRKRLIDGCSCRPMPWSESEVARHERYALIEAEKQLRLAEAARPAAEQAEPSRIAAAAPASAGRAPVAAPAGGRTGFDVAAAAVEVTGPVTPEAAPDGPGPAILPVGGSKSSEVRANAPSERRAASKATARPVRTAANQAKPPSGLFQLSSGPPKYRYPGD